jgi:hypothetical protein
MEPTTENDLKFRVANRSDFNSIKELLFSGFYESDDHIPDINKDYLKWCEENDMKDDDSFINTYFSKTKSPGTCSRMHITYVFQRKFLGCGKHSNWTSFGHCWIRVQE